MSAPRTSLTVLIGDLRGSRDLDEEARTETQGLITRTLDDLTKELTRSLATRMVLTAGDEVQAVFRQADAVVPAIQELTDRLHGSGAQLQPSRKPGGRFDWGSLPRHQIAFGIGHGKLSTGDLPASPALHPNPSHLDGTAFHKARTAIDRTKKGKGWVSFEGFAPIAQETVEALFALMESIRRDWADAQHVYAYMRRSVEFQKDVALKMAVSGSVVSESLSAAHYDAVLQGEAAARNVLREAAGAEDRA